ncbi:nuclear transport factor 2 family protein [Micromonospora pisi]|uniref:nuclear transport factor 2 family protein n=1 Tax=Micromonospora pisi TaxID=589240 RepID=UPI001476B6C9|nr:nuclear transport factor 2 family protein [Micromonospora pisi]
MEDIEEIHQLKARYFRLVDEKKHDELAAIFTPNAKLTTDGITWKSPKEFAYTIRDLTGAAPSAHSGAMPEITIMGPNTATGIWSMEDSVLLTRFRWPARPPPHPFRAHAHKRGPRRAMPGASSAGTPPGRGIPDQRG